MATIWHIAIRQMFAGLFFSSERGDGGICKYTQLTDTLSKHIWIHAELFPPTPHYCRCRDFKISFVTDERNYVRFSITLTQAVKYD